MLIHLRVRQRLAKVVSGSNLRIQRSFLALCLQVSESLARCTACESDFSIAHGGYDDVFRHTKTQKHSRAGSALKGATPLTRVFLAIAQKDDGDSAVIRAETLFSLFLVEHNIR